jgi:hypothetical protein
MVHKTTRFDPRRSFSALFSWSNGVLSICVQYLDGGSVLSVCARACGRAAGVLALDCVSCSEGLRFCDLFFIFTQILSRAVWLLCKPSFVCSSYICGIFFIVLVCFPLCVKGKHAKNKEKFHICNLSRQNINLQNNHKNFSMYWNHGLLWTR